MHRGIPWLLEAEAAEAAAQGHRVKRSSDEELMEEVGLEDDSDDGVGLLNFVFQHT